MVEEDFFAAELELVPVNAPVDIGFDRALVGAMVKMIRSVFILN